MKQRILLSMSLLMTGMAFAQQGQIEIESSAESGDMVRFYDPAAVGTKKAPVLNFGDIEGTPFWDEHWSPGLVTLRSGKVVKLSEIKVNQYSHEIHYLDGSTELSADGTQISKVVLIKAKDTTHVLAKFVSLPDIDASNKISFYRVANEGRFRLLEIQKASVKTSAYDPSLGKAENRWITKSRWVLADKDALMPLGDLDKDKILGFVKADSAAEAWLKANKNKLKNEADVVSFLNYWNKK